MDSLFTSTVSLLTFWPAVSVFVLVGIFGLKYGADGLVLGSANLGFRIGFTATMVGLTIVAFGTSAPEMVVSVLTAIENKPEICLGNVIGSNIANTTLVLGLSALIFPLNISKSTVREDAPLSLGAIFLVLILSFLGNGLSRFDGFLLVATFTTWMVWLVRKSLRQAAIERKRRSEAPKTDEPHFHKRPVYQDFIFIVLGLLALVIGAKALVTGAVESAKVLNVPEVVIGLTVVAAGTSLPELAVSVMAALQKHDDISVGNIMGSNIFNVLLILGIAVLIAPISFDMPSGNLPGNRDALWFDIPICAASSVLIYFLIRNRYLGRFKGLILTLSYIGYLAFLLLRNQ